MWSNIIIVMLLAGERWFSKTSPEWDFGLCLRLYCIVLNVILTRDVKDPWSSPSDGTRGLRGHVPSHTQKHAFMHECTHTKTNKKNKQDIYCICARGFCDYYVIPSGLCLVWPHLAFQQYSEPKHTFRTCKVYLTRRRPIECCSRWPCLPIHLI